MLWPYAPRPRPIRPRALLDEWLPAGARRLEHHVLELPAPPSDALAAVADLTLRELPSVRALFSLRGIPHDAGQSLAEFMGTAPFGHLAAAPGRELVFGIGAGHDWTALRAGASGLGAEAFRARAARLPFVAIGNLAAEPVPGGTRLWTETWVSTSGALPPLLFTVYWLVIGPFSAWTRRSFLRGARARLGPHTRAPTGPGAPAGRP